MAIVLSADETDAAMLAADAGLKFLMAKVDLAEQAKLYHIGITTVEAFGAFAADAAELKVVLKDNFGLDPAASLAARVKVAGFVIAFESAKVRGTAAAQIDMEMQIRRLPKPLPVTEYGAMRTAWEQKWWKLEDKEVPSRSYLEKRASELEEGEYRAESLQTVMHREQEGEEALLPTWDLSGSLKLRKANSTVPDPTSPEQLRSRLHLLGVAIAMLAMRHTNRTYLQDMSPQTINQYLAYLLGDYVYNLVGRSSEGLTVMAPTWTQLLLYELEVRKKAWSMVARGKEPTFASALDAACLCSVTKERFFTTPMALAAAGAGTKRQVSEVKGVKKGEGKGKKKLRQELGKAGKGKGKGARGATTGCPAKSPDGISLCFGYNDAARKCTNKKCTFLTGHLCGLCFGRHPMYACPGLAGGGQGETRQAAQVEALMGIEAMQ